MARQVQIRRGTSAQNNSFTGAIGEITMDTTNNTLRVHNGTIAGGTILAKKNEIPDISNLAKKTEIPDISGLAKKSEIPDISNLAKKSDIPDISGLAKKTDIPNVSGIIDYVSAWQKPTSTNNYTWYRKYKSGWVEMGGIIKTASDTTITVTLPVKLADTNYVVHKTGVSASGAFASSASFRTFCISNKKTTSFDTFANGLSTDGFMWVAYGMC